MKEVRRSVDLEVVLGTCFIPINTSNGISGFKIKSYRMILSVRICSVQWLHVISPFYNLHNTSSPFAHPGPYEMLTTRVSFRQPIEH